MKTRFSRAERAALLPGASFAACVALVDLLGRLLVDRRPPVSSSEYLVPLAILALAPLAVCWLPVLLLLARRGDGSPRAERLALPASALGLTAATLALVWSRHVASDDSPWAPVAFDLAVVWVAGLTLAVGLARARPGSRVAASWRSAAVGIPAGLAAAAAFATLVAYDPGVDPALRRGAWVPAAIAVAAVGPALLWPSARLRTALAVAAGAGLLASLVYAAPGRVRPRPDAGDGVPVVLVTVDTLRADHFECGQRATGPNLARLCRDSVVFDNAYASAPWTLPSMVSLMSGVSPLVHGVLDEDGAVPERLPTLASRLGGAGYRTFAVVHNAFLEETDFGFDRYVKSPRESAMVGTALLELLPSVALSEPASTWDLTREALSTLGQQTDGRFLLWLHFLDPHQPYQPLTRTGHDAPPPGMGWRFESDGDVPSEAAAGLDPEQRRWVERLYDLEIRDVDAALGRVLYGLRAARLYERALIVLTSDHGEEFWDHGGYEHGHTLYDELLRVPLLVKLPGRSHRGRVVTRVSTRSLLASILDVVGVPSPGPGFGGSLRPLWESSDPPAQVEPLVAAGRLYGPSRVALVWNGFKYVVDLTTGHERLYELDTDRRELHDLAAERSDQLERFREVLASLQLQAREQRRDFGVEAATRTLSPQAVQALQALGYLRRGPASSPPPPADR